MIAIAAIALVRHGAAARRRPAARRRRLARAGDGVDQGTRRRSGARASGWRSGLTTRRTTAEAGAALREATLAFRQLGVMQADSLDANTAAYSPDGRRIVTGGTDGRALVWDAATQREVARLDARHGPVHVGPLCARRRRDRCSDSRTARVGVTDASLGRPRVLLHEQGQTVQSVAFSRDGRRVAAALDDGTVRVLATDGSEPQRRLGGHRGRGPRRRHQRGRRPRRECRRGRQLPALGRVRRRGEDRSCTVAEPPRRTSRSARTAAASSASATTAGSGSGTQATGAS